MCVISCYLCPTCTNDRSSYWVWEPLYFWSNSGCRRSASARVQWGSSSPFKGHVFSSRVEVILQLTDPNFHSSTTRCFRNCPTPRSPGFRPAIESEQKYAWQIERIASKCKRCKEYPKSSKWWEKTLSLSFYRREASKRKERQPGRILSQFTKRTLYSMLSFSWLSSANMSKHGKATEVLANIESLQRPQSLPKEHLQTRFDAQLMQLASKKKYMAIDVCARNLAKAPCCTKALIPQRRVPNRRFEDFWALFETLKVSKIKKDAGFLPRFQRATERELWRQGAKPDQNLRARTLIVLKWASKPAQLQVQLWILHLRALPCIALHSPINLKQWAVGELIQLGERLEYEIWLLFTLCWSFLYARERKGKHPTESSKSSTFQANTTTGDFVLDVIRFEAHAKIPTPEILRERGS